MVDFGLACQFTPGEVMRQCAGTVVYVAPQAKMGRFPSPLGMVPGGREPKDESTPD